MSALDLIAGLIVGGYLVGVVVRGNTGELIELAKRDKAFLKWAIAIAALFYLRQFAGTQGIIDGLISAAIVGFLLANITAIKKNASEIWTTI